jgi:hypothetical protein
VVRTLFIFAIFCAQFLSSFCVADDRVILPDLEIEGPLPVFDLDEKMPLSASLAQYAAIKIRDFALSTQIDQQSKKIYDLIRGELKNPRSGYLIKVNVYVDEFGIPYVPGNQLLLPIGVGATPLDALASDYATDTITGPAPPSSLRDSGAYIWLTRDGDKLRGAALMSEGNPAFQAAAKAEADRRKELAAWNKTDSAHTDSIQRATFWTDYQKRNKALVVNAERAKQISDTTRAFENLQKQTNETLQKFDEVATKYADAADRVKQFQAFRTVNTLFAQGIETGEALSKDKDLHSDGVSDNLKTVEEKRTATRDYYLQSGKVLHVQLEHEVSQMQEYDTLLIKLYGDEGLILQDHITHETIRVPSDINTNAP